MASFSKGNLKAGLDSVRNAKLRSFWTCLGVIIGVASVITVVSIGEGIKAQVGGQIHHMGANIITVRPAQIRTGTGLNNSSASVLSGFNVTGSLTAADLATVKTVDGLSASAPLTIVTGTSKGDGPQYSAGFVIGTTSDLPGLLNQSLSNGVFITDDEAGQNVAVLGQYAAQKMFKEDVPLGRSFTFHGQQFIVQGIFNEFSAAPLSQEINLNNSIFIPNDTAENLTNNTAPTYEILARANTSDKSSVVASQIQHKLDAAHGGQSGITVLSGNQNVSANNDILDLLTRLIAGVAAISLLVGGVGIMNVMLVSVSERMHEIGIRKAIGATNRQILNQFLVESTVLSVIGGVVGILLAVLVDITLRLTTDIQPIINWQIVVLASGVSLLVGVVFGTVPAVKAARRDPIDALRAQ